MESLIMKQLNKIISAVFLAVALATVLGCAPTPTKEGTGEYVDDTVITTKVKAAIFNEPSLKSSEIKVETFKGTVQLSGFVKYQADISRAVEVARSVNGVKSVKNDMRLK
jgi:osmotically-inducible protein OsmY